ncbi:MAG: sulfotransferase family 2 domain-containing protein [Xanthomonadales bacterium]|nr:sulfotransferase family 2 domain-containing protein [Xanthomonadales bacterium]
MKVYDPGKPLFSIHIPKCGGSSVSNVLRGWFGRGFKRHYHDERRNRPPRKHRLYTWLPPRRYRARLCIHGHFNHKRGNGVEDYYPGAEQMITFVRDPFELHMSTYFYVRRMAEEDRNQAYHGGTLHPIIEHDWTLTEFLENAPASYLMSFLPADVTMGNFQQVLDERFILVGLTERLQQSMDVLAQRLGFPPVQVPRDNVSPRREDIPPGARESFARHNPLETAIYEHVRTFWDAMP